MNYVSDIAQSEKCVAHHEGVESEVIHESCICEVLECMIIATSDFVLTRIVLILSFVPFLR